MPGRSSTKNRCQKCRMYSPLCLCAEIPVFHVKTKLMVLMHWREAKLTTNTAHLACLALPRSEIHLRGLQAQPLETRNLIGPDENAALLFPSDGAIELNADTVRNLPRPLTLIVPDGSWRQARKVAIREQPLKSIPRLKLPLGLPSSYRLRHSPFAQNLSTFEAIARALGVLEGTDVQEQLEALFLKMVERTLWSRGKLNTAFCTTGIPQEAFEASYRAGVAGSQSKANVLL